MGFGYIADMTAGKNNIVIEQGADWEHPVELQDSDGNPINLTGYSAVANIRTANKLTLIVSLSTAGGGITLSDPDSSGFNTRFTLAIDAADTAEMDFGEAVWEMQITDAGGKIARLLEGTVTLSRETSDETTTAQLSLVATPGGSTSNSYATLAEASLYFEAVLWFSPLWEAMSANQKIARLISGSRAIDRLEFLGKRTFQDDDQALEHPRLLEGEVAPELADAAIDQRIKNALCEMVLYQYRNPGETSTDISRELPLQGFSAEGVSIEFDTSHQAIAGSDNFRGGTMESILALLRPWISSGAGAPAISNIEWLK